MTATVAPEMWRGKPRHRRQDELASMKREALEMELRLLSLESDTNDFKRRLEAELEWWRRRVEERDRQEGA